LARLGAALIEARENGADLQEAVASAIGWDKLARSVTEAERLARPDKTDLPALAARAWPVLHRLGPPCRPPPRPCARSSFCARFTRTAVRNGLPACRRAFSARLGANGSFVGPANGRFRRIFLLAAHPGEGLFTQQTQPPLRLGGRNWSLCPIAAVEEQLSGRVIALKHSVGRLR
jgi:hypothetical protein